MRVGARRNLITIIVILLCLTVFFFLAKLKNGKAAENKWKNLLSVYQKDNRTDRLIFVKYTGKSRAQLEMYQKVKGKKSYQWRLILSCGAYVGKNGIDKKKEGDKKTPTGTFRVTSAFGLLENPGTKLPYIKVNEFLYWSEEKDTYNQMVDVRTLGKEKIEGEYLIEYDPAYNYAMVIGYNEDNIYEKGSAIFLHVKSGSSFTSGCVAVSQTNMKRILKNATRRTRICIYDAS